MQQSQLDAPSTRERDLELGEKYAREAAELGRLAGQFLFRGQWKYGAPEWYDHRLAILDPERHATDFWTMSADNVIRVLPMGGRLLDLCSGDGFYPYWFYRHRADVVCVEKLEEAHNHAVKHWSHPRIQHVLADVLEYETEPESFDAVLIRGAIEHFNAEDQQRLFLKAKAALRPRGCFVGDTPEKKADGHKALDSHEHEFVSADELRKALHQVFTYVEVWPLISENRTTLFWQARA